MGVFMCFRNVCKLLFVLYLIYYNFVPLFPIIQSDKQSNQEPRKSNKWAVIIGVGQYIYDETGKDFNKLVKANVDAKLFRNLLLKEGWFKKENIVLLTDDSIPLPFIKNIKEEMRKLEKKIAPDDTVFFYYSGHGIHKLIPNEIIKSSFDSEISAKIGDVSADEIIKKYYKPIKDKYILSLKNIDKETAYEEIRMIFKQSGYNGEYYLALKDSIPTNKEKTWLSLSEIVDWIENDLKVKNSIIFLDACRNVDTAVKGNNFSLSNQGEELYQKNYKSTIGAIMFSVPFNEEARQGPRSNEDDFSCSVFTHYLINGLRGAADKDEDKLVSFNEIHEYTASNVEEWYERVMDETGKRPTIKPFGDEHTGEFYITAVPDIPAIIPGDMFEKDILAALKNNNQKKFIKKIYTENYNTVSDLSKSNLYTNQYVLQLDASSDSLKIARLKFILKNIGYIKGTSRTEKSLVPYISFDFKMQFTAPFFFVSAGFGVASLVCILVSVGQWAFYNDKYLQLTDDNSYREFRDYRDKREYSTWSILGFSLFSIIPAINIIVSFTFFDFYFILKSWYDKNKKISFNVMYFDNTFGIAMKIKI